MELVRLGPVSIPALIDATTDTQPRVRGLSCVALGALGTASDSVVSALRWRLDDDNAEVRFAASWAFGELTEGDPTRSDSWLDEQLRSIEDANPHVREAGIEALGRMELRGEAVGSGDAIAALTNHLIHDDYYQCRLSAALALWRIGQAASVVLNALTTALSDPHPLVQEMAAQVLGSFGPKAAAALPALRALAAAQRAPTADLARNAIARIAR
jgi:HEAT repeat protein